MYITMLVSFDLTRYLYFPILKPVANVPVIIPSRTIASKMYYFFRNVRTILKFRRSLHRLLHE